MTRFVRSFIDAIGFLVFPSLKTIHDSKIALASLAKHFGSRVSSSVSDYEKHGVTVAKSQIRFGSMRLTAYASELGVVFDCKLGRRQRLRFSVNNPDRVAIQDHHRREVAGLKLAHWPDQPAILDQWLSGNESQLRALALTTDERMEVFADGLSVTLRPAHATPDFVHRLIALAESLPRESPEEASEEASAKTQLLPENLRPLAKWLDRWAIGDDVQRGEAIRTASSKELLKLCHRVEPLLPAINDYLQGLGDLPHPEAAVNLMWLAETVAEIRATDATGRFRD